MRLITGRRPERGRGHLRLEAEPVELARLVAGSRVPTRIEIELARGIAREPRALHARLAGVPWESWLPAGLSWAVRVVAPPRERRDAARFVRLVREAVEARHAALGRPLPPVDPESPRLLVTLRVGREHAACCLDVAGGSLHRRGTPTTTTAPLREDLAAGVARLARPRRDRPIVDPFCGSGALVAETVATALDRPPRRDVARLAAFRLPALADVDPVRVASDLAASERPPGAPYLAADEDAEAVAATRRRLARGGLAGHVEVRHAPAEDLLSSLPAGPGLIVTNPPWGHRHAGGAERAWRALARLLVSCPGWRVAILAADDAPRPALPVALAESRRLRVGTLDAVLLLGTVRAPDAG